MQLTTDLSSMLVGKDRRHMEHLNLWHEAVIAFRFGKIPSGGGGENGCEVWTGADDTVECVAFGGDVDITLIELRGLDRVETDEE